MCLSDLLSSIAVKPYRAQIEQVNAVAVAEAGSCSSDSTPSLGNSMNYGCNPKKQKKYVHTHTHTHTHIGVFLEFILIGQISYFFPCFEETKGHFHSSGDLSKFSFME